MKYIVLDTELTIVITLLKLTDLESFITKFILIVFYYIPSISSKYSFFSNRHCKETGFSKTFLFCVF